MGPGMGVRSCMRVECVENVRERKVEKKIRFLACREN